MNFLAERGCWSRTHGILRLAVTMILLIVLRSEAHVVSQLYAELEEAGDGWELEILFDAGYADAAMRGDPGTEPPTRFRFRISQAIRRTFRSCSPAVHTSAC